MKERFPRPVKKSIQETPNGNQKQPSRETTSIVHET
jgi:hypothetical protein